MPTALEIESLGIRFDGRTIIDSFSLTLAPGERAILRGDSGAGKTAVLRCLVGFATPSAGRIRIEGQALDAHSVWRLRRRLAYVEQEPNLGAGSVREILERPFAYRANAGLEVNLARAPELLERFGLARRMLDEDAASLSGGEKQRVAIIGAILLDRPIHILDEPASALDAQSARAVVEYYQSRPELTVLAAAHDPDSFPLDAKVAGIPCLAKEGSDAGR